VFAGPNEERLERERKEIEEIGQQLHQALIRRRALSEIQTLVGACRGALSFVADSGRVRAGEIQSVIFNAMLSFVTVPNLIVLTLLFSTARLLCTMHVTSRQRWKSFGIWWKGTSSLYR
jgi:hypothetical protein